MFSNRLRFASALAVVAVTPFLITGCSQQAKAERDGRDLADAVCDLRHATDKDAATSALEEVTKQLDDLQKRYGVATAEDRNDIQNNLADLAEHSIQGNEVLIQQDLEVLRRSAKNIKGDVGDVHTAAWRGFADGVEECVTD